MIPVSPTLRIENIDPVNHLNCRSGQLLAHATKISQHHELLFWNAFESCESVFRHCFVEKEYRWSYRTRYINHEDVRSLGIDLEEFDKIDLETFKSSLKTLANSNHIGIFYAPRGYFKYWLDFMEIHNTLEKEYFDLHSFYIYGATEDMRTIWLLDNTTENTSYITVPISMTEIEDGYFKEPERWFLGCINLSRKCKLPKFESFLENYINHINQIEPDFELYDFISRVFMEERGVYAEIYRSPTLNSLSLLAGSRYFFYKFLCRTTHQQETIQLAWKNYRTLHRLLDRCTQFHTTGEYHLFSAIQSDFAGIGSKEALLLSNLKNEAPHIHFK
jgi:hypothetical protein